MKTTIHTNLATIEYVDRRLAFFLMLSASAFILSISLILIHQFFNDADRIRVYQGKILQRKQQTNAKERADGEKHKTFTKEQQKDLLERIVRINRLIAMDIFPWNRILEDLERSLPEGLYIESFVPVEDFSSITLKGRADSESKVAFFYKRLEENKIFEKNALTTFQVKPRNESNTGKALEIDIQFTMECRLALPNIFADPHYHGIGQIMLR